MLTNPITAIIGAGLGIVEGIFAIRAHHAAAVKTEAAALNSGVPAVRDSLSALVAAFNGGTISAAQASAGADSIKANFENLVYKQAGVKKKTGNGPDVIEKNYISKWVASVKSLVSGSGGTFTSDQVYRSNNGFNGLLPFTVTVNSKTAAASASAIDPFNFGGLITTATGGAVPQSLSTYFFLAGAVLVVLYFFLHRR